MTRIKSILLEDIHRVSNSSHLIRLELETFRTTFVEKKETLLSYSIISFFENLFVY